MPTRKLVLNRETIRKLNEAPDGRNLLATGSVNDSCNMTLCTTEGSCYPDQMR